MLNRLLANIFGRRSGAGSAARAASLGALLDQAVQALRGHRIAEAVERYTKATTVDPENAELHCNLGTVLKLAGRAGEALAHYRAAVELKPELVEGWYNLGLLYAEAGEIRPAEDCYRQALEERPKFREAHSSLLCLMTYLDADAPGQILAEHLAWNDRHGIPLDSIPPHANERVPDRRLRVGYVSADFREHAVAYFFEPVLAGHERAAFETFLYSNRSAEDVTARRLRGLAASWRSIADQSDDGVAELVRRDGIDILVDLSGHTEGNRLGVFVLKPAPVQVCFLGYPNTTGLAGMDYRITDHRADPPGDADRYYCERLLRMPASLWCYRPPGGLPEVSELPARRHGKIRLGSFNNVMKLSDAVISVWSELLRALPESQLLIAAAGGDVAQRRLRQKFAEQGIDARRLEIMGRLPAEAFRKLYGTVDIALDSFPCNGGTTTCETLWMGVPVVTLAGNTFSSRAGLSILSAAGLEELIALSRDEYVEICVGLAGDPDRMAALRRSMRDRLLASPITDEKGYVHALEERYREAWRRWCVSDAKSNPV